MSGLEFYELLFGTFEKRAADDIVTFSMLCSKAILEMFVFSAHFRRGLKFKCYYFFP